jgi:hypothetical protein
MSITANFVEQFSTLVHFCLDALAKVLGTVTAGCTGAAAGGLAACAITIPMCTLEYDYGTEEEDGTGDRSGNQRR